MKSTINGIGERAGNAALEEVAVALEIRKSYYQVRTDIGLNETIIQAGVRFSGIPVPKNKAVVGGMPSLMNLVSIRMAFSRIH